MKYLICVLRTLFYTFFLFFSIGSIAIILNPNFFGIKYIVVKQQIKNLLFRTTFEEFKPTLKYYSYVKLSRWNDHNIVEIIEDGFMFEYHYWCKYKYIDKNGDIKINIDHVIHNWKPWEYYYLEHDKNFITEEHNRACKIRKEWIDNYRDMEIEKHRRYQID